MEILVRAKHNRVGGAPCCSLSWRALGGADQGLGGTAGNLGCIRAQLACHDPRLSRFLGQQRLEPRQPGFSRERSVAESVPLAFLHMLATLRERRA